VTVVAAVGLASVPIADAKPALGSVSITSFEKKQNRKIRRAKRNAARAHDRIESLRDWNFDLTDWNRSQQESLDELASSLSGLEGTVNGIIDAAIPLVDGVLALQAALEDDVAPALEAIDAALNDPTTGLVGLNLARPQFGAFAANGDNLGSTGLSGGSGPTADAVVGPDLTGAAGPDLRGTYVVDFENDVSSRMYSVNMFPAGPGVSTPVGSAANCSVSGIDTVCGLVGISAGGSGAPDPDPNKVLVQVGDGDTAHPAGFSVTAISG
jgi:hypothetical protein